MRYTHDTSLHGLYHCCNIDNRLTSPLPLFNHTHIHAHVCGIHLARVVHSGVRGSKGPRPLCLPLARAVLQEIGVPARIVPTALAPAASRSGDSSFMWHCQSQEDQHVSGCVAFSTCRRHPGCTSVKSSRYSLPPTSYLPPFPFPRSSPPTPLHVG